MNEARFMHQFSNSEFEMQKEEHALHQDFPISENAQINTTMRSQLSSNTLVQNQDYELESQLIMNQSQYQDSLVIISPHQFQKNIVSKIREQWSSTSQNKNFGSIVFLDTGSGKTYIALMMIKEIFGEKEEMKQLNQAQLKAKYEQRKQVESGPETKKVVFLVPTNNLVDQQGQVLDQFTEKVVGRFHGGQKHKKFYKEVQTWTNEFKGNDIFVFNGKKFYDLLMHGYLTIQQIDLIIFDECHHTDQDHLYNLIMKDFYFHKLQPGISKRPKILGLTASPIKQKIDCSFSVKDDILQMLQNLCNNLFSRFIPISDADLDNIKNEVKPNVIDYEDNFQANIDLIKIIEKDLILKILELIPLPKCYKIDSGADTSNQVMNFLQSCVLEEFQMEQDTQLISFLTGRKKLIEFDSHFARSNIDLNDFRDHESRLVILLAIIILKNINNLLIELGMAGVNYFLKEIKELFVERNSRFKVFRERLLQILESFLSTHEKTDFFADQTTSPKIQKLVSMLRKQAQHAGGSKKSIIFVKDRSVAYYLKQILVIEFTENDSQIFSSRSLNQSTSSKDSFYSSTYGIGFAMGQKGKSLLNRAYKSTNTSGSDIERDISYLSNSFGSVQMSNTQLMQNLHDFKQNKINLLIATNVVEEGLDVSTCNQVICLNELLTVKAFIQMKGRARQKNSQFVFICSTQQKKIVEQDYSDFKHVIDSMQQIAYREVGEIQPYPDIIETKQLKESEYFQVPETEAKVTNREAKILLDLFITSAAEDYHKMGSRQIKVESQLKDSERKKVQTYKAVYEVKEQLRNNQKYFFCTLFMPRSCEQYLQIVDSKQAFTKKREAENHVALIAIQKLYKKGLFSAHLYPNIGIHEEKVKPLSKSVSHGLPQMKERSRITEDEEKQLKDEQKLFHQKQKRDKSREYLLVEQKFRSIISLSLSNQEGKLYLFPIAPLDVNSRYPFKTTTDLLGFLFNRKFSTTCIEFQLQQEVRQKQKNQEYLLNQLSYANLTFADVEAKLQSQNRLNYQINSSLAQELTVTQVSDVFLIQRLRFFHTWLFYSMYSADHKFYKAIFKDKFPFVQILFQAEFIYLKKHHGQAIKNIYGLKASQSEFSYWDSQELLKLFTYVVPLVRIKTNGGERIVINERLINNCIDYVKMQLLRVVVGQEKVDIHDKYHLEGITRLDQEKIVKGVWNCDSNQIRHVVIQPNKADSEWDQKNIQYQIQKPSRDLFFEENKRLLQERQNQVNCYQYATIPEHYLFKLGVFLDKKENKFMTKCRKERHFLDFNIEKEGAQEAEEAEEEKGRGSTQFDVPDQLLHLAPLSYDQFQVAQQACTFFSKLNEYLMVELFINTIFRSMRCFEAEQATTLNSSFAMKAIKSKHDIFQSTQLGPLLVTDVLLKNYSQVTEALTSPAAHREQDYERLEFLGDSIISFLVIVELFLTKEQLYREGDLDFHRIRTVSNMNFMKVNKAHQLYQYMIIEPQKIFSEFTPGGFEVNFYQNKLKHKHLNELNNKIKYLKSLKCSLESSKLKRQEDLGEEKRLLDINEMFMKNNEHREAYLMQQILYLSNQRGEKLRYSQIGADQLTNVVLQNNAYYQANNQMDSVIRAEHMQLLIIDNILKKAEQQKAQNGDDKKHKESVQFSQKKPFFYKQLADVVESMCASVALSCGLNSAQDYLRKLDILKFDQDKYREELDKLDKQHLLMEPALKRSFYQDNNLNQLEAILDYQFKCKSWLVEALTHKSFNESLTDSSVEHPSDYERLEFLGDSILNYSVAKYFYKSTENDQQRKMPKDLHKMKTSIVNNVLLSLVVIESQMHNFIIYNQKALQFKQQFESYVNFVKVQLMSYGSTLDNVKHSPAKGKGNESFQIDLSLSAIPNNQSSICNIMELGSSLNEEMSGHNHQPLDLDLLYEHSLKIFGDVFEAIIGAIFLDSRSVKETQRVLFKLLDPYIGLYANLENMQDHSRTKLLELWNSRTYSKNLKCFHKSETGKQGSQIVLKGFIGQVEMLVIPFEKDAKNKIRSFYKKFFKVVEGFISKYELTASQKVAFDEQGFLRQARAFALSEECQIIVLNVESQMTQ